MVVWQHRLRCHRHDGSLLCLTELSIIDGFRAVRWIWVGIGRAGLTCIYVKHSDSVFDSKTIAFPAGAKGTKKWRAFAFIFSTESWQKQVSPFATKYSIKWFLKRLSCCIGTSVIHVAHLQQHVLITLGTKKSKQNLLHKITVKHVFPALLG